MFGCRQCGFELKSGVRYCSNCAAKVDMSLQPAGAANALTGTISGVTTMIAPEQAVFSSYLEAGMDFHGRYKIERKLGQGAMGVVYLAGDKLTGRQVALKLINPKLMNSASARDRFFREGLIARDIRHKNVIAVYDVSETDGQLYLVMEYLSGVTLRNWIHRMVQAGMDVPYATAEKIVRNILEGLDAAHAEGVIHRDIKPENIMFTGNLEAGDYRLKILDFGIAHAVVYGATTPLATTSMLIGTALYMAPEQITAADTVGPPADLYAVSSIFYELLLGVAPTGRWAPLSRDRADLPACIDGIIDKGLTSRPRSRYQNAQEYLKALDQIQNAHLSSPGVHSSNPATSANSKATGAAPESHPEPPKSKPKVMLTPEEEKLHRDAMRFARLLVAEIKLFDERNIVEGRANRDLYLRLKRAIDRSREMYEKRISPGVAQTKDYFHDEIIRVLGDNDPASLGIDYPGPRVKPSDK